MMGNYSDHKAQGLGSMFYRQGGREIRDNSDSLNWFINSARVSRPQFDLVGSTLMIHYGC